MSKVVEMGILAVIWLPWSVMQSDSHCDSQLPLTKITQEGVISYKVFCGASVRYDRLPRQSSRGCSRIGII